MKKNPASKSGIFTTRVVLAFALCSAGVSLAVISLAAPTPSSKSAATGPGALKPVVIRSTLNGVSPAARDLPIAAPTGPREVEHDLLRVKPNHPVPPGFVDPAAQTFAALLAMPAPLG